MGEVTTPGAIVEMFHSAWTKVPEALSHCLTVAQFGSPMSSWPVSCREAMVQFQEVVPRHEEDTGGAEAEVGGRTRQVRCRCFRDVRDHQGTHP